MLAMSGDGAGRLCHTTVTSRAVLILEASAHISMLMHGVLCLITKTGCAGKANTKTWTHADGVVTWEQTVDNAVVLIAAPVIIETNGWCWLSGHRKMTTVPLPPVVPDVQAAQCALPFDARLQVHNVGSQVHLNNVD